MEWSDDTPGVNQVLFSGFNNPQVTKHPPLANAGPDQTLECAGHGGTPVTLNGSGSTDPEGTALSYAWTDEASNVVGTTAIVQLSVTMGVHTFTLTVTNTEGLTSNGRALVHAERRTLQLADYARLASGHTTMATAQVRVGDPAQYAAVTRVHKK